MVLLHAITSVYVTQVVQSTKTASNCFEHIHTKLFCRKSFVRYSVKGHQAQLYVQQAKDFP